MTREHYEKLRNLKEFCDGLVQLLDSDPPMNETLADEHRGVISELEDITERLEALLPPDFPPSES